MLTLLKYISSGYFIIGETNDKGFTDYVQNEYRPDPYNGLRRIEALPRTDRD